ncbi:TSUP family transporter [Fodinicurvata sp. EGI_FJ10296]|uniref:TSUP family transporter n=1 Tax=Fodinicurvata sp. EGI_FJ10296 TaxID=3231908 RepID=UPI0034512F4B
MTGTVILIFAALVFATSFLSGIFGMAGGMILMGGLLLMMPVPAAMILHGVTQMAANGWRAFLWRRYIDFGIVGRFTIGIVASFAVFSLIRLVPDERTVFIFLGLSPFVTRLIPTRLMIQVDRPWGGQICGFICTAFQYLAGVAGPLLDLFFVRTTMDRRTVVATKGACQTLSHLAKLGYFVSLIDAAGEVLTPFIVVVAVASSMVGTTASRVVLDRISDAQFRQWTGRIVMAIGAVFLVRGILG